MQVSNELLKLSCSNNVTLCVCSTGLVIDGSIAYNFNDGAKALLEVHPEDALLTIDMK